MKKIASKVSSLILCFAMILTMIPSSVFAETNLPEDNLTNTCSHSFELTSEISQATCNSRGETVYTCSKCGETKTEYISATTGYTWDFAEGSETNTGGVDLNNELSLVKGYVSGGKGTTISSMSDLLSDGTLNATGQTTLKMSESVTLSSNNDWTIELTAKGDGTNTMRSFLSTGEKIGDATYLYIDGNGDLSIVKKGDYTDDNGTARSGYTYYKVSNSDYNNSALKSGDFDITEYHTYQIRCINGTFSFWLDGTKVGDYALSETTAVRGGSTGYTQGSGTPFDFSTLAFNYFGCGNSSNSASQGFTGTVKYFGIYTGHTFDNSCDIDCNNDGCSYVRETSHTWDSGNVISQATCNSRGEIVYTCTGCGETKTEYISATTGYTWDFSEGSATNTGGVDLNNELSLVKGFVSGGKGTTVSSMSDLLSDGTLNATGQTTLKMSESVTLSSNNDWTIELTAKGDGTNTMRSFLSTGEKIGDATYLYIDGNGDLSIVKKGSYTDDNGTARSGYTYYKVSNSDYNNSALKSGDFDITEYHTYQIRCINGTFSFWLDGTKVGDYALSETTSNRGGSTGYTQGSGTPFDFSTLTFNYFGCGNSSSSASQGFTGTVKYFGIYTGHTFDNSCDSDCNNDGCSYTREVSHTWDDGIVVTEPTETEDGLKRYTCSKCGATKDVTLSHSQTLEMKYDDRLDVTELGQSTEPVITNQEVTSKKVGTETLDDNVVVYVDGKLIATGVGTADVTWNTNEQSITYHITVETADISLLMVTGHSLGSGSKGDGNQNIVCEEGQVYSTNERAYAFKITTGDSEKETVAAKDVTGMGLGYSSELRPTKIDALNESGDGVNGCDSALAYEWTKLTGEKVWILNSAKGSTSLSTWQEGGYNYRHAVTLFTTAEKILYNEVQAGHYNVNKMGIINYTTANGDQTWAIDKYNEAFNSMWNGFKTEMGVYDFDGDGNIDTVDCIGLIPLWNVCAMNDWSNMISEPLAFYNKKNSIYYGKLANYYMSEFEDEGVIMASLVGKNWTSDSDVEAYFAENPIENLYGILQNGTTHTSPTTMKNGVYGDGVHYGQLGYNVQGVEAAESLYEYWYGKNEVDEITLLQVNGVDEVPESIELSLGDTYIIVPEIEKSSGKLEYEIDGDSITYDNCMVTANSIGESTLIIKAKEGSAVAVVDITVVEKAVEEIDGAYYVWDFAEESATNTSGSELDNELSLVFTDVLGVKTIEGLFDNGTLNCNKKTKLKFSKSITMNSENNWMIEFEAKGKITQPIRSFLSTDEMIADATYLYIPRDGDLSIVKKGSYKDDNGKSRSGYVYYKVSDASYNNSILATEDFDVTVYHNYQVRCIDGVLSYWLDGTKIGDFELSETSSGRGSATAYTKGNGTPFDFSKLTFNYFGCGNSSDPVSQGTTAVVKKLGLYTDECTLTLDVGLDAVRDIDPITAWPGDSITLPTPSTGDYCSRFIGWNDKADGTGNMYSAGETYTVKGLENESLYGIWQAAETGDGVHDFVDDVCTYCGAIDESKNPYYSWSFNLNTQATRGGTNALSLATTNYKGETITNNGTMSVANGKMNVDIASLELSKTVVLDSSKKWAVDFTMKAKVDGDGNVVTPKTLFAEDKLFSVGTSAYLTANGNLILAQKGTVNSTTAYWYYMVSESDFNANMPESFDITKNHTYRLMCTDGVFSYWLDGEKIGDLNFTTNAMGYSGTKKYEGRYLDYSTINAKYIGNGNTSRITAFGFTGEVDEISFYTQGKTISFDSNLDAAEDLTSIQAYMGESLTLVAPETGDYCAKFVGWKDGTGEDATIYAAGDEYVVSDYKDVTLTAVWEFPEEGHEHSYDEGIVKDATCKAKGYTTHTCSFCGHTMKDNYTDIIDHDFSAEVISEEYLKSEADYSNPATYYKSCSLCGDSSEGYDEENTFIGEVAGDGYYNVISRQDWNTAPGITESEIVLNTNDGTRRQVMHVMEADISNQYVTVTPSYYGMTPTEGSYKITKLSTQAAWAEENLGLNIVGAMNTSLSWYTSSYYTENSSKMYEPLGLYVYNGIVYAQNDSADTCLVINYDEKDGEQRPDSIPKVQMRYTTEELTGWEEQVISCNFDFIVKDGKSTVTTWHENQASKSVVGIKADGTIVIMEADGREAPNYCGMSVSEIAEAMIKLGCVYAIRGDGGGSSTFMSKRSGGLLQVQNSPSDGVERNVTSGIFIISTAPADGTLTNADLSTDNNYYAPGCTVEIEAAGTDYSGASVEIPDDAVWSIKEEGMGTIESGVFVSNGTEGTVTVQLSYNEKIIGNCSFEIVVPDTLSFKQSKISVPFGKTVELTLVGTVNNGLNTVTLNPDGIKFELTNSGIGSINGIDFTAVAEENAPALLTSNVTATLLCDGTKQATAEITLGRSSVVIEDFENGTSSWTMKQWNAYCAYEKLDATEENGYVHSGDGALGMIIKNDSQTTNAGHYAQFAISPNKDIVIENATSIGAWIYVPDDFYSLWIEMQYYTKDSEGNYTISNDYTVLSPAAAYTTLEESGWHYFSLDVSEHESIMIKSSGTFIEALIQHCGANELLKDVGSPHGQSAIYIDDITVDYSAAADDKEEPIFGEVLLRDDVEDYTLEKNESVTTDNNLLSVSASVEDDTTKANASGIDAASAKAYVDGVAVDATFANGLISISDVAVANGTHRVKFEIADNSGNKAVVVRVINVETTKSYSTIEVTPRDTTADKLLGGSLYWVDINATRIQTIKEISMDIDLNAVNHWELDHMELATGFTAEYTIDEKTNTATITITRTGVNDQAGKKTIASLPIRVIYYDTDIALSGYTAETFWNTYDFWPQDVKIDVDRGEITYVDGFESEVLNTFSSPEYAIDTEMYTNGLSMDTTYKEEKGTAHVHTVTTLPDKAATCTETGYTGRTYCEECDSVVDWGETVPIAGHSYKLVDGQFVCSECGDVYKPGTGVFEINGDIYYTINGEFATGWQKLNDYWYYFKADTKTAAVGDYTVNGVTYHFDEEGKTKGAWYTDSVGTRYYDGPSYYTFSSSSYKHLTQEIEGKTYIIDQKGYIQKNRTMYVYEYPNYTKVWYCCDADGVATKLVGPMLQEYEGEIYGIDSNGNTIQSELVKIDNDYYFIGSDGIVKTNYERGFATTEDTNSLLPAGSYIFGSDGKLRNTLVEALRFGSTSTTIEFLTDTSPYSLSIKPTSNDLYFKLDTNKTGYDINDLTAAVGYKIYKTETADSGVYSIYVVKNNNSGKRFNIVSVGGSISDTLGLYIYVYTDMAEVPSLTFNRGDGKTVTVSAETVSDISGVNYVYKLTGIHIGAFAQNLDIRVGSDTAARTDLIYTSIQSYYEALMEQDTTSDELKQLLSDTATFAYNIQKLYPEVYTSEVDLTAFSETTTTTTPTNTVKSVTFSAGDTANYRITNATVKVGSKVAILYYVKANADEVEAGNVTLQVKIESLSKSTAIKITPSMYDESRGLYIVTPFEGVTPNEYGLKYEADLYVEETHKFGVSYSINSYCYSMYNSAAATDDTKNLALALYRFGEAFSNYKKTL